MPPTGPTSAAGKKRSAANALKHGLLSERVIVDDLETQEDWERHRQGIVEELGATGVLDHTLGEQIASVLWRLARCSRAETGAINQRRRKVRELLEEQGVKNPATGERLTLSKAREEAAGEVERLDWLRSLPELSGTLGLKPRQHEELLIEAYLAVEERAPRAISEELRDWIDAHQAYHTREGRTTTVGTLREGFRHFASRTRMSLEDVYGVIIEQQELRAARLALEVQRAEAQLRAALEDAQLPEEADLQRYIRYEAHLGRQLARLHRLLKDHHQAQAAAAAQGAPSSPQEAPPAPSAGIPRRTATPNAPPHAPKEPALAASTHDLTPAPTPPVSPSGSCELLASKTNTAPVPGGGPRNPDPHSDRPQAQGPSETHFCEANSPRRTRGVNAMNAVPARKLRLAHEICVASVRRVLMSSPHLSGPRVHARPGSALSHDSPSPIWA